MWVISRRLPSYVESLNMRRFLHQKNEVIRAITAKPGHSIGVQLYVHPYSDEAVTSQKTESVIQRESVTAGLGGAVTLGGLSALG